MQADSQTVEEITNKQDAPLKNRSTWMRILYMLLFIFIYGIAEIVLVGVVLLQTLFKLFTGNTNDRLLGFGDEMSRYMYDMWRFLTFNCEDKPFPFNEWKKT